MQSGNGSFICLERRMLVPPTCKRLKKTGNLRSKSGKGAEAVLTS